jgi:[glutamine synthetase] adenylyltransferase / [glutamine synthetase]-adenylyl-L-tyrosine phosphorylase
LSVLHVSHLPLPLAAAADAAWRRLEETVGSRDLDRLTAALRSDADAARELATLFALSDFAADAARRDPEALLELIQQQHYRAPPPELPGAALAAVSDVDGLRMLLRRLRNAVMLHILWRDLNRRADVAETTGSMTRLADHCIDAALSRLHDWAVVRDGTPLGAESGTMQRLAVIALGKLGAGELNVSSDVDLVFGYTEEGSTADGARTNQQFFVRLAQRLIQVLDDVTADGFVFRVDMRLRPYGDSGALVLPFDVMETYYEEQGRDWERYAWIRGRPCAGDVAAGASLVERLRPFVYRRYLDFGAIGSLRDMKARIAAERGQAAMADDVKLGQGGIREIEFIAQMHQLIWGGRRASLQIRDVVATLGELGALRLMDRETTGQLAAAYGFLRNVEHRLQAIADRQTQKLPGNALDEARIAFAMGEPDYDSFLATLAAHRAAVARAFDALLESSPAADVRWQGAWLSGDLDALVAELVANGFGDAVELDASLRRLCGARDRPAVAAEGRKRLDALVPRVIAAAAATSRPGLALQRVVPLLEATLRRSAYYVLLLENPAALQLLVQMCGASRWLAEELQRYPALLDELLDPALLYTIPDSAALRADLRSRLAFAAREGEEAELEALRSFKETHAFRVAACELRGILPLMNVSDYLTYLAEVILAEVLQLAWQRTAERQQAPPQRFAIIGFGKLGGLELGPGSDLDVVFLHDVDAQYSGFLQRMVRRLLHLLTTRTHTGALYDVDTRLRPSGRAGTMVSSLAAFEQYQQDAAWVWEHQALVRARPVAGDAEVGAEFQRIRRAVLCRPRDRVLLRREIVAMRRRIEAAASGTVDLKREPGGIVDIEFMVQYLVLAWSADHPTLADWTDNVRILDTAASVGLLERDTATALTQAYLALRAERHREALDIPDDGRARDVLERHRSLIREQWQKLLLADG